MLRVLACLLPACLVVSFGATGQSNRAARPPDFQKLLTDAVARCLAWKPMEEQRTVSVRFGLTPGGEVVRGPIIVEPRDDTASILFQKAVIEAVKTCAPYGVSRSHARQHDQWKDMLLTFRTEDLSRSGAERERVLSGGAKEFVNATIRRDQDYVEIGAFTTIDQHCRVLSHARIRITEQPEFGRVRAMRGPSTVISTKHPHCSQTRVNGALVRYDRRGKRTESVGFSFIVRFEDGETRTIVVNLKLQ